jgi:hypothetical protein
MRTGFTPKKPQQRTALFGDSPEPLVSSTRVLPRDDPHVTGQQFAIHEPPRVTQEYVGRQCRDRPHSRMRHAPSCSGALVRLLSDLLRQVFDFLFHLPVHGLQRALRLHRLNGNSEQKRAILRKNRVWPFCRCSPRPPIDLQEAFFFALTFAHLAFCAAAIFFRVAADIPRFFPTFLTDFTDLWPNAAIAFRNPFSSLPILCASFSNLRSAVCNVLMMFKMMSP